MTLFRKAVLVLMLLAAPLMQARTVLVCSMMDDQASVQCCCENERRPAPRKPSHLTEIGCCVSAIEITDEKGSATATDSSVQTSAKPDGNGHALVVQPALPPLDTVRTAPARIRSTLPARDDSRLYLRTARLRL